MVSYAQFQQDLFVLAAETTFLKPYAVEVGAGDGLKFSNTKLLEENGWRCLCIEASPCFETLIKYRKGPCVKACVFGENKSVNYFNDYRDRKTYLFNGILETLDTAQSAGDISFIETVLLSDILDAVKAPKRINYLSLNVNGAELSILKTFPFNEYHFDLMSIKIGHNKESIKGLMEQKGYKFSRTKGGDDWFTSRK